jgi:hypothetical protein
MTRLAPLTHERLGSLACWVLLIGYGAATAAALILLPFGISGGFLVALGLALISTPLLRKVREREPDPVLRAMVSWGLVAAFLAGVIHFYTIAATYDGLADASYYHGKGAQFAAKVWDGEPLAALNTVRPGTAFLYAATGVIYTVTGPTILGGHIVYSWIAYWGLYFCYRAFRTALPQADHRRYAILIFFLPSTLFWSCAISKESWMMLGIGLTLLGTARLLAGRPGMLLPAVTGLTTITFVRPHISVLFLVAIMIAVSVRRGARSSTVAPLTKGLSLSLLIVVGVLVGGQLAEFVGVEELNADSISDQLDKSARNTADEGESTFEASPVNGLLDLPWAVVSVLFRPFPWEAGSALALICSGESMALALLVICSGKRWRRVPRLLVRQPYVLLAVAAIPLFAVVLSTFGNFGLLVRERLMVLPLVFVPLCLAPEDQNQPDLSPQVQERQ